MLKNINNKIRTLTLSYFPYTNVIGLSRSILALGTFLTLLFNPINELFHRTTENKILNSLLDPLLPINKYNFFILFGFENIIYMKFLALIILIILITGYFIKITSILHWWISISFLYFSSTIDGGDQINSILTLLIIPLCLTDSRKNHWKAIRPFESPKTIIAIFSVWIIRLQIAIIYFHTSISKFEVTDWKNGTAIYYWLNHGSFGMPTYLERPMNYILSNFVVVSLITYGVLVFEILLFLAYTSTIKYRKKILYFGILFHFSFILFHGIFSFFFSMAAGLILYLYPTYENINFKKLKNAYKKNKYTLFN